MTDTVTTELDADIDTLLTSAKRLEVIVLERGGGKDACYGTLALLLVIAAGWLLVTGGLTTVHMLMAAGSGLFFGGLAVLLLRRWLTPQARRLRLSPEGFEFATMTARYLLRWTQVGPFECVPAASIFPGRGDGKMIVFKLTPKPAATQRIDAFGMAMLPLGSKAGIGPTFGLSHADLIRLLETYRVTVLDDSAISNTTN